MYICVFVLYVLCVYLCAFVCVVLSLCVCVSFLQYIHIKERPSLSVFLPDCVLGFLAVMLLISPVGIVIAGVQIFFQTFLHINLFQLLNNSVGSFYCNMCLSA